MKKLMQFMPDAFTSSIIATVGVASVVPCYGLGAVIFNHLTIFVIGIMFFMQGARLSREAVFAGLAHWRLHMVILSATFLMFPLLTFGFRALFPHLLAPYVMVGILYISLLPSTVQSSIAFTSIAHGNVPAAICAATFSTILGVIITPIAAGILLGLHHGGADFRGIEDVFAELLLPFVIGHLLRPWLADWAARNQGLLKITDRGSIILVVYTAFSAAVMRGIWNQLPLTGFGEIFLANATLLAAALLITRYGSRALGFAKPEEIAIVFCGSKKSAATGVPMANILFSTTTVGFIVLPLIIFHQMQLLACSILAKRYARQFEAARSQEQPSMAKSL